MNDEQLAALTAREQEAVVALRGRLGLARASRGTGRDIYGIPALQELATALADARLEGARLTEQRNATDTYANRLAAERDRQCEDIRRLVEALRGWHHPHPASCSLCLLLAEMKERYDA